MPRVCKFKDPAWKYGHLANPHDKRSVTCNFCGKVTKGGIFRLKQHLIGGHRNRASCIKTPKHVKDEIGACMSAKKKGRDKFRGSWDYYEASSNDEEDNEDDVAKETNSTSQHDEASNDEEDGKILRCLKFRHYLRKASNNEEDNKDEETKSTSHSSSSARPAPKVPKPTESVQVHDRKRRKIESPENDEDKEEMRMQFCNAIAEWMYDAQIPFDAVSYDSFKVMIEATRQCGPSIELPSYYEVKVPLLKKQVENTQKSMGVLLNVCQRHGCSIMCDGWKDRRKRTLINLLINCSKGSMFLESIDASNHVKSGDGMYYLLSKCVEKIGEAHVVQVITDSTPANVLAGKLLEVRYPHLYWTPCAAHSINLILEDIFNISRVKIVFQRAVMMNSYIYARAGILNMMRKFTKHDLFWPTKTRFATATMTLARIHKQHDNLKKMFTSEDWVNSPWAQEPQAKKIVKVVLMPAFWNGIVYTLKLAWPLIRVLRLVKDETNPPMAYIYDAMDRAKAEIEKAFNHNKEKYMAVHQIIEDRWSIQLNRPLHLAGRYLNPQVFYSNPLIVLDLQVMQGLHSCIQRLIPDINVQNKISEELDKYMNAEGFETPVCIRQREQIAAVKWWDWHGHCTPNLRQFAMKVLSLACSVSSCEISWGVFEDLNCKQRNKLDESRFNDVVFVKCNRALAHRYNSRNIIDPICVDNIDESHEWLLGKVDGEIDEDDFEDEILSWGETCPGSREPKCTPRPAASMASTSMALASELHPINEELYGEEPNEPSGPSPTFEIDYALLAQLSDQ